MKRPYKQGQIALIILMASVLMAFSFTLVVNVKTVYAENPNPPALVQDYNLKSTAKAAGLPIGEADPVLVAATIINVVLGLVGVLAVILIIYGGFSWMTAAGNEEKITKAKKVLSGAIIGLIIIMASFIISSFIVKNLKTVTSLGGGTPTETFAAGSRKQGETCYKNADCGVIPAVPPATTPVLLVCRGAAYPPGQCQP